MKLCVFTLLLVIGLCIAADDTYTTKFDGINIDEILESERLFDNYYKCLINEGKCTPDGRELKKVLPDALQTECSKCSEKQRDGVEKVLKFVIEKKKDHWKKVASIYDPEGVYAKKYEAEAKKRGYEIPAKK